MSFEPTKEQQNEALAGLFELYYNPLENRFDHYIFAFLNSLMLYPDDIKQVLVLAEKLNNQLAKPLNAFEKELAYQRLEEVWG
ncbi:hypothetical protein FKV75_02650 [Weissella paramesenteroides]|uniref:hypothetical protein n=1 Tax=Weissella paramesenteroides TaxID=1249 RepID=UPI001239A446|nr:hypothetical protein [Weissella paramesenteroides]KAA8439191.1 hypothetical protein FKV81_08905 [Weissella paramesenteroides]KAA8440103.1 hypothetical protein FKV77_08555 [Weissella paramesenteroides]KAA8443988.1 hypothetical protein FKV75_02650 [Weissella paramesenteroides]KAA8446469.1 hypothetical protein FKV76_06260 [Weissella paramesenteroides]KAA8451538.1 hypothetical protein FKV74_02645 [Weissella paramesenteroides]